MENLTQLICSDSPPLMDNPFLQDKQPQFQLLYQEIEYLRTFVMVDRDRRLARRLRDVVNEAEYIVDLFLTNAFIKNNTNMTTCGAISTYQSPNFDSVVEEIKSIKKEFMDKKMQSQTKARAKLHDRANCTTDAKLHDRINCTTRAKLHGASLPTIHDATCSRVAGPPVIKAGMQIAKKCQGLPLAVVVIAGLLVKGEKNTYVWEKVAESGLPKKFGKDPELRRLIWFWVARNLYLKMVKSFLEEVGEDYLMVRQAMFEIGWRTLVIFFHNILVLVYLSFPKFIPGQQRRLFADSGVLSEISSGHSTPHIRSFLCFNKEWYFSLGVQRCFHPFLLLRVLDLLTIHTSILPLALELLIHLRHLALWSEVTKLPSSVCNLWNLQTLILKENYSGFMKLPENIAKMVNLRHMWIEMIISIPDIHKPSTSDLFFNLQTISMLKLHGRAESMLKRVPNVRKLGCAVYEDKKDDAFPNFSLLDHLETLKVIQPEVLQAESMLSKGYISFPVTLKKLTLSGCRLPWFSMSTIQSLPNLEILKLLNYAFEGPTWDTGEGQFRQLKFLKLQNLDIHQWEAYSTTFPCLTKLVLLECYYLKGIPEEVGEIPTLEMIDIDKRNHSLVKSTTRIREQQHAMGNYELKINVIGFLTSIR
ncbi:disease resistance protein [Tanacetum coccineum]